MNRAIQQVYNDAISASVYYVLVTGVCGFGIVHLVYKAPWDLTHLHTQLLAPLRTQFPEMH